MLRQLASIGFLLFMAVTSILFYVGAVLIWLVTVPFDRRLRWLHLYSSFWASFYLWTNPQWEVRVEGREHIDPDEAYVIVSNHQSALDILVAFRLFTHFKWVSKAEMFKVPLIGWNMYMNRYVKLHRGDPESAKQMMDHCRQHLKEGSSVWICPEGTRSRTGELRRFKLGAFRLAQEKQAPLLPIAISGTKEALPKKSLQLHGHHVITVKVLRPIPYEYFADKAPAEVAAEVRELVAAEVAEHAAALEEAG